jgi:hypothetical protein
VRAGVAAAVTRPLDWLGHAASVLWRSVFITAAALAGLAGLLHALGRVADAYSAMLVAGALGAVGTALGVVALRVEPDAAPSDAEVPR